MDVRRRTFLKTAALAAVGSALPGCQRQTDRLIPYLLPDDEIIPGVADWYASVCSECRAGCGVLVRVREGRAKKIEGNPEHPVNQGKLCAWGQASLQGLYNPDRVKQPLQRKGVRGEGLFIAIDWEEGLQRCTEALRARQHGPIMISRPLTGTMSRLLADFMDALGGRLYYYAPDAELPLSAAWQESVGTHLVPRYDLAQADYLLAHDFSSFVNATFHRFFPKAGFPMQAYAEGGRLMFDPDTDTGIADLVAAIHTISWPVTDPARLSGVRDRLKAVLGYSRQDWDAILAETDDNHELLPSPKQTSMVPEATITDERVAAWRATLDEADKILDGTLLVPHWRFKQGFDLKAYFTSAKKTDLVMLLTGADAVPYIKDGPVASTEDFRAIQAAFGNDWLGYAFWFN